MPSSSPSSFVYTFIPLSTQDERSKGQLAMVVESLKMPPQIQRSQLYKWCTYTAYNKAYWTKLAQLLFFPIQT